MDILSFLDENNIEYQKFDHPPVFTIDDCKEIQGEIPGAATKNIFLRDKKGKRHIFLAVHEDKRADLKALAKILEVDRLSFASPERLMKYIGVEPGSVTLLGLITDKEKSVELIIDTKVWEADAVHCHPMVNTATLSISQNGIRKFFELTGHKPKIITVPEISS